MPEPKPLRADARRNRVRVLEAAETVFARDGTSAPTEEVAKEAGVGVGTVFRHFPTKEALLEAVLLERMRRFAADATTWAEADEPGTAFYAFLSQWADMAATKNAYSDALAAAGARVPRLGAEVGAAVRDALNCLLSRAQEVGAVRDDVGVTELIALMVGASRAAEHLGDDPALRQRTLEIVFDGLRPAGVRPARSAREQDVSR
ncbi:helix-turn-helix domain-containing protein [Amycolatopsis sp.]|uniref:TetR/AcrR family transcriptional regulator n=1 Tax=Amycolatopsis sp. TaxID=37632 RepID=UPI002CF5630A|nr:helix-turn-helix domain-containing protein [Amycolatopsis sp.]HVV07732.1 helix-turn-helix domain-containing protein [Amycolatopsis sp.]